MTSILGPGGGSENNDDEARMDGLGSWTENAREPLLPG
jgi:hypothetical protein